MRRLGFDQLTPYSFPGGVVQGQVHLELDQPARARDLTVRLFGRELSQATVSTGKSTQRIVDEQVFLDQTFDLRSGLTFADPDHLAPGSYPIPFQFTLPVDATPSLATSDLSSASGWMDARPDGMYVEYLLEARLDVPWWLDAVTRTRVPVYSPRRVLGAIPTLQSQPNPGHASLLVTPDPASPLLPGTPLTLRYQVLNPGGKRLEHVDLAVVRQVEYRVKSMSRSAHAPAYSARAALGGRESQYAGQMTLEVPNTAEATGPWQGRLFRTYWLASAVLDVELGFNVQVQAPLVPA